MRWIRFNVIDPLALVTLVWILTWLLCQLLNYLEGPS